MSKCTTCGTNFVSAPESPTPSQECKYCQIQRLTKNLKDVCECVIEWKQEGFVVIEDDDPISDILKQYE